MTNFRQVKNNRRRGGNIKDGGGSHPRDRYGDKLEAEGFFYIGKKSWSYTWQGEFPKFTLTPGGLLNGKTGFIAHYKPADIEILFPYGADPAAIKARLDDEISAIMQLQADIADSVDPDTSPLWVSL